MSPYTVSVYFDGKPDSYTTTTTTSPTPDPTPDPTLDSTTTTTTSLAFWSMESIFGSGLWLFCMEVINPILCAASFLGYLVVGFLVPMFEVPEATLHLCTKLSFSFFLGTVGFGFSLLHDYFHLVFTRLKTLFFRMQEIINGFNDVRTEFWRFGSNLSDLQEQVKAASETLSSCRKQIERLQRENTTLKDQIDANSTEIIRVHLDHLDFHSELQDLEALIGEKTATKEFVAENFVQKRKTRTASRGKKTKKTS